MSIAPPAAVQRLTPTVHTGLRGVLWLFVAGCLAWALVRVFGLDAGGGALVMLMSFTPYAAAGSVVVLAAALGLRSWWAAGVAAVAAVALVACLAPRFTADGTPLGSGPRLRVLTSNMLAGGADATTIMDIVRREHVDVLALQEFTPEALANLEEAGLSAVLPYRSSYPVYDVEGSGLFSRYPLTDAGVQVQQSGFRQAHATLQLPGAAPLDLVSVHPCAPSSPWAATYCWRTDLLDEPHATPDGTVRVLVGDCNSTLDHAQFRRLIATGYRDAADVRGAGLKPTWPFYAQPPIPPVTIDHVLADRRVGVARYAVFGIPRSDHHAVFAELVLP